MNGFILRVNSPMQPWDIGAHRFRGFLPVFLGEGYRALETVEKVQRIFAVYTGFRGAGFDWGGIC
jgi:hypothetical protein